MAKDEVNVMDQVEVWSNSCKQWCPGTLQNVEGSMISVRYIMPTGQVLTKQLPNGHEHIRHVANVAAAVTSTRYQVRDQVEVWSISREQWYLGTVLHVEGTMISVSYALPDGQTSMKQIPDGHEHLRCVSTDQTKALPGGVSKGDHVECLIDFQDGTGALQKGHVGIVMGKSTSDDAARVNINFPSRANVNLLPCHFKKLAAATRGTDVAPAVGLAQHSEATDLSQDQHSDKVEESSPDALGKRRSLGALFNGAVKGMDMIANRAGVEKEFGWVKAKASDATSTVKARASEATSTVSEKLSQEMEKALVSADDSKMNRLLDSALDAGLTGRWRPAAITDAANRSAAARLQGALQSGEPKALKAAMIAAQRLHASHLPEYQEAAHLYATVRQFPAGWTAGLALQRRGGKFVAKTPITEKKHLRVFQQLLDMTHRKVYTRDRNGEPVPDRLKLVGVVKVENADKWVDYMAQQETIRQEIARDAVGFQFHEMETMAGAADPIAKWLTEYAGAPPMDPTINEVWLFHGTRATAAEKIAEDEFKINMAGSNAGTLYGRGIYLAESPSKSDEYAEPNQEGLRTLLLCRTTMGRVFYTAEVQVDAQSCEHQCLVGRYHGVLGDRAKARGTFREFVIFDDAQVYCNYVLVYRREYTKK